LLDFVFDLFLEVLAPVRRANGIAMIVLVAAALALAWYVYGNLTA